MSCYSFIWIREETSSSDTSVQNEELSINEKLLQAAESGDHEGVSRALEEGAEINFRDELETEEYRVAAIRLDK